MKINKNYALLVTLIGIGVINTLFFYDLALFGVRTLLVAILLLLLPGVALLTILRESNLLKKSSFSRIEFPLYSIGISLSYTIFVGLATNTVLPFFGIYDPLHLRVLLPVFEAVGLLVFLFSYRRIKNKYFLVKPLKNGFNLQRMDFYAMLMPVLILFFGVSGTVYLNNTGIGTLSLSVLVSMICYFAGIFILRDRLNVKIVYPWAIYFIGLTLLLMTSLRGWYTTGHDNQLEHFVYMLTQADHHWDIAEYRDPYNASMSITVLPAVLGSLFGMSGPYVFKVIYQVLFALTPVALFFLSQRFIGKHKAFIGVFVFMSLPTFITDMPMLNRQELAMLFFVLILMSLFNWDITRGLRRVLFLVFGFGMALSHYSTTYIALAMLLGTYVLISIFRADPKRMISRIGFKVTRQSIELVLVLALIVFTFFWNVQVTKTTGGLTRVVAETTRNIDQLFNTDLQSGGVLYSFFSFEQLNEEALFDDYIMSTTSEFREDQGEEVFYGEEITSKYPIGLITAETAPLTSFGVFMSSIGIDPFTLNTLIRQFIARSIQLLIILGVGIVFVKRKDIVERFDIEQYVLSVVSLGVVGAFIVLPVLSVEYGTQRLFQQMLLILTVPLVVGTWGIAGVLPRVLKNVFGLGVVMFFFVSLSGILPEITGGFRPQLHLNDSGVDYDSYYTHESEAISAIWLAHNYNRDEDVYSSVPMHSKLAALSGVFSYKAILPGAIRKDAYVYLDYVNTTKDINITAHKGDSIRYTYPTSFMDDNKDLIYSNPESKIYR